MRVRLAQIQASSESACGIDCPRRSTARSIRNASERWRRPGKLLESLGHPVELAHPAVLDDPKTSTIFNRIWPVRLLAALQSFERKLEKKAGPDNLDPDTLYWLDRARGVSATDYRPGSGRYGRIHARVRRLVGPDARGLRRAGDAGNRNGDTQAGSARHGFGAVEDIHAVVAVHAVFQYGRDSRRSACRYTGRKEVAGGRPIGSGYAREDVLIRLAAQLEQARPWSHRIPPVHA